MQVTALKTIADRTGSPSHKGKLVQAASFWTFLCKRSCCMPAASLRELYRLSAIVVYVFRVPHNCQSGALLSALFHCHRPVAFTDATHALQALFAPLKP